MAKQRQLTPKDVDRISEMDETRRALFYRDPERPDDSFFKSRGRVHVEVRRAQQRLRTSRWRSERERRKAPTVQQIGMALVEALVTSDHADLVDRSSQNFGLVKRALLNLEARGYNLDETKQALRRRRNRMVDPADRQGEASESTGAPITPTAWGESELLF
jgi:hypothetical protein